MADQFRVLDQLDALIAEVGEGPADHAVEMFAGLLAEIRAYGEGLVIAEQIPSKLLPDAIKNSLSAAFLTAANRKFGDLETRMEIVDFVGWLRGRDPEAARVIDPNIAERVLVAMISDSDLDDLHGETDLLLHESSHWLDD